MKKLFITIFCTIYISHLLFSQNQPKQIYSNVEVITIQEDNEQHYWELDPSIKLDVYTTDKSTNRKDISIMTDIDTFNFVLYPDDTLDCTIILNEKYFCKTRFQFSPSVTKYLDVSPEIHDTIHFELTDANNIKVPALLNGIDQLQLHFDTGASGFVITQNAIIEKLNSIDISKRTNIKNYQPLQDKISLQVGGLKWENQTVYPVSISPEGTDGHFGWNIFDGLVVEIDYDNSYLILHSHWNGQADYKTQTDLEFVNSLFCIDAQLGIANQTFANRFLFDTGYQRAILLDRDLNAQNNFPADLNPIKETILRNGQGDTIVTKIVVADFINLESSYITDVPTQLIDMDNPARFKAHILGNELLKRFNTVLDFQNNKIYLKSNSLADMAFIDLK